MLGLFYNYRERKSRKLSRISVNSFPIRTAFGVFLTNSLSILKRIAVFLKYVIAHRSEFGTVIWRLRPNPAKSR